MVDKLAPPVEAAYQLYVPEHPLPVSITVPGPQRLLFEPDGTNGIALIVAVVATFVLGQLPTVQST